MHVPAGHRFPVATGVAFASAWARHRCLQLYFYVGLFPCPSSCCCFCIVLPCVVFRSKYNIYKKSMWIHTVDFVSIKCKVEKKLHVYQYTDLSITVLV